MVKYLGITLRSMNSMLFQNNYVNIWNEILRKIWHDESQYNSQCWGEYQQLKLIISIECYCFKQFLYSWLVYHLNKGWKTNLESFGKGKNHEWNIKSYGTLRKKKGWVYLTWDNTALIWMKDWLLLRNRRLLELEGHKLRFGRHGYLCYHKIKVNVEINNHYIRIMKI